ncbi:Methyltransferase domain-containing protein [Faunimonas pinastri]|uniref:Methyltransferase domain-containing protein n=1 Tax=Faunimonas pinastri TaxID=1855383 RepID=A0A1H9KBH9_9HYPH|nr:class I SAM-dependent methyltransferase [Faunimonas pinastri]SEQ96504.1 Methyltransferase domain-containing protein [Faunimonas pinastri]
MNSVNVPSSRVFDRDASEYDALRRALIPCFDSFYGTALDLIADWHPGGSIRVLDLGAGTGLFSGMILDGSPAAHLHLLDASPSMLDEARKRLHRYEGIEFSVGDMAAGDLGGPFDLVVSALAIHHLDNAAKRDLFLRIRRSLAPGGLFVNAEQVLGPTPRIEADYARRWLRDVRAAGVPEDQIGKALERMMHDRCASVEDQLGWMREAGLVEADCSFKAWRFAVLNGKCPA